MRLLLSFKNKGMILSELASRTLMILCVRMMFNSYI